MWFSDVRISCSRTSSLKAASTKEPMQYMTRVDFYELPDKDLDKQCDSPVGFVCRPLQYARAYPC